jgi:peroxiredoxin
MVSKSLAKVRLSQLIFLSLFLLGMAASPPLVGGPAPAFKLESLDGQIVNMTDLKGINFAESKEKVDEYLRDKEYSFPILLDGYGNVSQEYEVLHLPVTYFITPDGVIREKVFGGGVTQKMIEAKIKQFN